MTFRSEQNKKRGASAVIRLTWGQWAFCLVSIFALVLTFLYSDVAIEAMSVGMKLCVGTVIPSLFPFMVFSELFVSSGAAELVSRLVGKPLSWLFGISGEGGCAVLLGFLCGFPIGTRCAISLYKRGRISQTELEHICSFCNNPSSAFLISAVGITLFGSKSFGVLLYFVHLLSSSLVGIISGLYYRGKVEDARGRRGAYVPVREGFCQSLASAVKDSAGSMLFICAFVVFFSALVGYLRLFCDCVGISGLPRVMLFGFFEMTSGVASASALPLEMAPAVAACLCGWSGLSVHFQLVAICGEHKISLRPYILSKLACGALNFAFISLFLYVLGDKIVLSGKGSISSLLVESYTPWVLSMAFAFAFACLWRLRNRQK